MFISRSLSLSDLLHGGVFIAKTSSACIFLFLCKPTSFLSLEVFIALMNEMSRLHFEMGQIQLNVENYEQFHLRTLQACYHFNASSYT